MVLSLARALVALLAIWFAVGVLFALAFAWVGVARVDREAKGASFGFRLLILPASAALWPLLLWRWMRGQGEPPTEHNAHRDAAVERRP